VSDPFGGAAPYPSGDGDRLVAIHDHLRGELEQLGDLVGQVARGHVEAGTARSLIATMTMRQNNWTLGTYCATYCRVLTTHHTIEDLDMFRLLEHLAYEEEQLVGPLNSLDIRI